MGDEDRERIPFIELLEQCRAGNAEAMAELFSTYNGVIREAIRRKLPDRLRQEFDSLDFAQDVWADFCAMAGQNRFPTPQALHRFLITIAQNKVTDTYRRRVLGQAYTVKRDEPLVPLASSEPSPSQWAIAGEQWANIASHLPAPHVAIVERIRDGFSQEEVASMAGISVRTVARIVDKVQRLCEGKS